MAPSATATALKARIDFISLHPPRQDLVAEVLASLQQPTKKISPKFFYDERGSQLFEAITRQPEYYPTRAERQILSEHAEEIAACLGSDVTLIEPGCGSCEKVRLLLDTVQPQRYIAMDISEQFLLKAANQLALKYPWLEVTGVCADFAQIGELKALPEDGRRIAFYPGSTLGNFAPEQAQAFLRSLRQLVGKQGGLLIGVDTHKATDTLNAAYNDAAGITADFNLNVLTHLNRVLPADFDPDQFVHVAFYNESLRRIEMHLESRKAQTVTCAGRVIALAQGERIHTECSYKYSQDDFAALAEQAGFRVAQYWQDKQALFGLYYCTAL